MTAKAVVVIGAGLGGLTAAVRLARHGYRVRLLEARDEPGGLASGLTAEGFAFDGGPYVLLDRPGLEWAFRSLGAELGENLDLLRIEHLYEVLSPEAPPVRVHASLEETAEGLERDWPGSGTTYTRWVHGSMRNFARLQPLLHEAHPRSAALRRPRAWPALPFLLRPLSAVLARSRLPAPVREALGIWTHVAAQDIRQAPSLLALVPALIHGPGAWYPRGGMAEVPAAMARMVVAAGVGIEYGVEARRIRSHGGRLQGVETTDDRLLPAAAVVANTGLNTYVDLVPVRESPRLRQLPLQSPGVCAYVAARGEIASPYLRFRLPPEGGAQLWIRPGVVDAAVVRDGWWPARLLAPMAHAAAEAGGRPAQAALLDRLLAEEWWRENVSEARVLERRLPVDWGREFRLHRDSMNPVMTSRLMRAGRLPHRSPWVRGLYLAGSATHPGQWVSFCAISGVLAADCLRADMG